VLRFLRFSHIFASVVREIFEVKLLNEASSYPLTPTQFQLIKLMAIDGHHQVGEVADFLGVSPPAATKNIDKLERLGLVARSRSPGDRRATLLSVSRKGRRLVRKYEKSRRARLAPMLQRFGPEELEQLSRSLERFSVFLLGEESTQRGYCLRCAGCVEEGCPVGRSQGGCPYERIREAHDPQPPVQEVL
jgi:DNA-binding MarR family transcriptional regulator